MNQRFVRCAQCGLPHDYGVENCPTTGLPLAVKKTGASPSERPIPAVASSVAEGKARGRGALVGRVVGDKYAVRSVIGEGGMGVVYEAEQLTIGRLVAIKVLHARYAGRRDAAERLVHEARVVGSIGHPGICAVYDVGRLEDRTPYLVMERLRGETVATRLAREGRLGWAEVREILAGVLAVLAVAHGQGVVHRDLKPDNIFLAELSGAPRTIKLLDFGISKADGIDDDGLERTKTGLVMGTPYYMAPEQARGDRELDGRVDLWALGVIAYELLSGERPFTARNYNALLMRVLTVEPKALQLPGSGVSPSVAAFVGRALMKEREERFGSAREMLEALPEVQPEQAEAGCSVGLEEADVTIREEDWDGGTTRRQVVR